MAPSRFPGPSLALLTAPCCACDAWRTKIRGLSASAAKESFRHVVDVPEGAERAIEVIAARSGGCNRGTSIVLLCCSSVRSGSPQS